MQIWEIDPLQDPRWPEFLESHALASVFHTTGWLRALRQTYSYQPIVYTTTEPGEKLTNGWVFCRVKSWITGNRLVSLPFSDHCDPLFDTENHFKLVANSLKQRQQEEGWDYVECRPLHFAPNSLPLPKSEEFCFHNLSLSPDLDELFHGFHKESTQRKIRRAEREGLSFVTGSSDRILDHFYHLQVITRRRHKRLPQPRKWFATLAANMGDNLKVRVAYFQGVPIASILTLLFKTTLVYKYGSADDRFFRLGGMQSLVWRAIEDAKQLGLRDLDLGRSDSTNQGLIVFKSRLGARDSTLTYFRFPPVESKSPSTNALRHFENFVRFTPTSILEGGGGLLYRHFG